MHEHVAALRSNVAELGLLMEKLLILASPKGIISGPTELVSVRDVLEDVGPRSGPGRTTAHRVAHQ